jgi:hypothetical protein
MKSSPYYIFFLLLLSCHHKQSGLPQLEVIQFRTSYNYGRDLSNSELDSLKKAKPYNSETEKQGLSYQHLVRKGMISNDQLDTTNFNFCNVGFEKSKVNFLDLQLSFETDKETGEQRLTIQKPNNTLKFDFEPNFLDNRWASVIDIDDDGKVEVLILEKYYMIGGDNLDLKIIRI